MRQQLFNITLQDDEQIMQLSFPFGLRLRAFDAMMKMGVNQIFCQRFERLARRNQLHEYLRTIAVFLQHPLNGVQLADDATNTDLLRAAFTAGMAVLFHTPKNNTLVVKAQLARL